MKKLTEREVKEFFFKEKIEYWIILNDVKDNSLFQLGKYFKFKNFKESLNFVNKIGKMAESINHHPDIKIEYNEVFLFIKTHEKDSITELDLKLVKMIEEKIDDLKSN